MEEESERLKEEERCDAGDMQLLANSPRPGERTRVSRLPPGWSISMLILHLEGPRWCVRSQVYSMDASRQV